MKARSRSKQKPAQILFGGSGALLPYQMGIGHYLMRHVDPSYLRTCSFGGVSGGAATSAYLAATVHGFRNMKQWYSQHLRQLFTYSQSRRLGSWGTASDFIWELGASFFDICHKKGKPFLNNRYHATVTIVPFLRSKCLDVFRIRDDFGDAMRATSFVPGITAFRFRQNSRKKQLWFDGVLSTRLPSHPERQQTPTLMIDVLGLTRWKKLPPNVTLIDTKIWRSHPLINVWIHGKPHVADDLFALGWKDARDNRDCLLRFFDPARYDPS